jgi:predicted glycosyltransferase involved in capsule biosynthesis
MIAVVTSAYKIPQSIVETFVIANSQKNIKLYVIAKEGEDIKVPEKVTLLRINFETKDGEVFNIGRASNLGIKQAIEDGCKIIVKTDIDCILSQDMIKQCNTCVPGIGFCYRHHNCMDIKDIPNATIDSRCIGSICLHADDLIKLNAFDERMDGYSVDDIHMVERARRVGVKISILCEPKVYHIVHSGKWNRETINPEKRKENNRIRESNVDWSTLKTGGLL